LLSDADELSTSPNKLVDYSGKPKNRMELVKKPSGVCVCVCKCVCSEVRESNTRRKDGKNIIH